jgi:hypothetical protein
MSFCFRCTANRTKWFAALFVPLISMAVALGAGCAVNKTEPDDSDLRLQAASHAFGGRYDYLIVKTAGEVADRAFIEYSRTTGTSDLAKKLAARLAPAENEPVRLMVTGQNSEKTLQVILDALAAYRGRRLPHLQFLYLGEPGYAPRIESAILELGGSFHFTPFAS